jgi:predicted flavoprotein YhiN
VDLLPARTAEAVLAEVTRGRGTRSLSTHLKSRLGLDGVKMGLLHERLTRQEMQDGPTLARAIKHLPIALRAPRPIDEAISSAGGVGARAVNEHLMLQRLPGVFCAGEMLDWEAPTGGYLLTACFATGRWAGAGAVQWLNSLASDAPRSV